MEAILSYLLPAPKYPLPTFETPKMSETHFPSQLHSCNINFALAFLISSLTAIPCNAMFILSSQTASPGPSGPRDLSSTKFPTPNLRIRIRSRDPTRPPAPATQTQSKPLKDAPKLQGDENLTLPLAELDLPFIYLFLLFLTSSLYLRLFLSVFAYLLSPSLSFLELSLLENSSSS